MKRYTKREVSRLLGEVRRREGFARDCPLCQGLDRVVRQMRRDLAEYDGRLNQLADKTMENVRTHERLRKQLDEAKAAVRWRPIETAPRDGTFILAYWDDATYPHEFVTRNDVVQYLCGEWCLSDGDDVLAPTHWMPLPDGPGEGRR